METYSLPQLQEQRGVASEEYFTVAATIASGLLLSGKSLGVSEHLLQLLFRKVSPFQNYRINSSRVADVLEGIRFEQDVSISLVGAVRRILGARTSSSALRAMRDI